MKRRCLGALSVILMTSVVFGQSPKLGGQYFSHGSAPYAAVPTSSQRATGTIAVSGVVKINGAATISGQTLFSGNTVQTAPGSSSTLDLINSARLKLGPETELRLEFSRSSVIGSIDEGRIDALTPAGLPAEFNTADASIATDASQPAVFSIQVESCITTVSVQTGRIELRTWDGVRSLAAGEHFSTGNPQSMPGPQRNFSKKARIGLVAGIGAAVAVLLVAITGKEKDKTIEQFGGCIDFLSGESNCH